MLWWLLKNPKKDEEAVLEFEGKTFNVTLSGGIASYSADGKGAQDLVHAADEALYQAKESGWNRNFIHDLENRDCLRIGISEKVQNQSVTENLDPKELNAQGKMSVRQESFLKASWLLKLVRKFK